MGSVFGLVSRIARIESRVPSPAAYPYADVPDGGTVAVLGLGPVGQMCVRVARHVGAGGVRADVPRDIRVIGVDRVPARLRLAAAFGAEVVDLGEVDDVPAQLVELTGGRGPDAVVDAVGMEAHGAPLGKAAQAAVGRLPDLLARPLTERFGVDRLTALHTAIRAVRRGGTVSLSGVYGGELDPMPMMDLFDKSDHSMAGHAYPMWALPGRKTRGPPPESGFWSPMGLT